MRLSQGFWQTYKEVPSDAEISSHQLMIRAGLIHKSGAGLYNFLPFGLRVLQKVEQIIRQEMLKAGALEIQMSMVTPGELWKESGRWDLMTEMCKFKDKREADVCLSPTNEEAVVHIVRKAVKSYKDLPFNLFQINTKFRDEIRPRFGLMRAREFLMKDGYSFHCSKESLDQTYQQMYQAYHNILTRIGLDFVAVVADGGAMASSDQQTHEFQVLAEAGEDEIVYAPQSGEAANIERAKTKRAKLDFKREGGALSEVETKDQKTIDQVAHFLKLPKHQTLKSLVYKSVSREQFYMLLLLGDDELNEVKLGAELGVDDLEAAKDSELLFLGLMKGFIGPVGLEKLGMTAAKMDVVFDQAVDLDAFYVVGAQKEDTHFQDFCPTRDLGREFKTLDIRKAKMGDLDSRGKEQIVIKRGIEVGHIFQLGDKYSKAMNFTVLDQGGKAMSPLMGCYGMGVSRLVAAIIEQHHDSSGIIWPMAVAPAQVHFVAITKSEEMLKEAQNIYQELLSAGVEVVFDDRKAGPGFKFKDADLLGLPIQLTFGERDFQNDQTLEIKKRTDEAKSKLKRSEVVSHILKMIEEMK